ncbi:WAT1-related protein [Citrus sinensis]|uniref:WAT1-related protein n=1 Tax=Citrus sinensis TaxID=2711 RepID=A0ACB8JT62_CITSI|nr:WAT1-related protein [Citrus sinensis]
MKNQMLSLFNRTRPFIGVIFMQVGFAGMDVLCKAALNKGMSPYVLVVYRHAAATIAMAPFAVILDQKIRPKMTLAILTKLLLLGLLEPVIDQNLYFIGMKYTTATFAAAMYNILPAITFLMAWTIRLENVNLKSIRSLAKAITLKAYPAELSLTAWICFFGTVEGTLAALIMERGKASIWAIHWDTKLVASVYSVRIAILTLRDVYLQGIICSGLTYYIQGIVMKDRGPVFVAAFSPLCMVIVAIMSTIILAEQMYLGRIIGAIIIIGGLYLVVWGKSKDHKSPSPSTDEHLPPAEQTNNTGSNGKENFGHEVTKIDV